MDSIEYSEIINFFNLFPNFDKDTTNIKDKQKKRDRFKRKADKFYLRGDDLYRKGHGLLGGIKVVLKGKTDAVLRSFHWSAFGGHSGINKTRDVIKARYWWFGMTEDIKQYISSCEACQKTDPLKPAKKPELQQIKVSKELKESMEVFSALLLVEFKTMEISLEQKTTLVMTLAAV